MSTHSPGTLPRRPAAEKKQSDVLWQCMHCGLCLSVCPTYALTKKETSSPRGRIRLVKALEGGAITGGAGFDREMNFCLGCYACTSACPAGVRYEEILDRGREALPPHWLKQKLLRILFLKKSRFVMLSWLFRIPLKCIVLIAQYLNRHCEESCTGKTVQDNEAIWKSAPPRLLRLRLAMTIYLKRVLSMAALCPVPQKKFTRDILPPVIPAIGTLRARVALFTGCIMDVAAASIHADTAVVLAHNGCEVHLVAGEECCGAVQGHTGDLEGAKIVAKKNMEAFGDSLDAIVVNAAGCGAYLKKYAPLFRDDDKWKDRAQAFSARVRDIQEFLDELGLIPPTKPVPLKAAIQEPCHLVHAQKIPLQTTLRLLRQIPGLTLVPLEGSSDCCGSAGIYNITHFTDSMEVLDKKMKKVSRTGADILLAANPGCLFQLRYGIQRHHLKMEVLHPMTLLAKAYQYEFQGQYT